MAAAAHGDRNIADLEDQEAVSAWIRAQSGLLAAVADVCAHYGFNGSDLAGMEESEFLDFVRMSRMVCV